MDLNDFAQIRHISARLRVNVCSALGIGSGALALVKLPWQLGLLIGWCVLSGTLVSWIWTEIGGCDPEHTRARSTTEDSSRLVAIMVMVTASVMSLIGVALGLAKARQVSHRLDVTLTVVSLLAVVLSWLVVHTMFTLRYAHQYYLEPAGGIDFPGHGEPDYSDFAYFAFTVGMSFAVSDPNVTSRIIRRIVLRHALISYLFGTVIVGMTINVMAGFIR